VISRFPRTQVYRRRKGSRVSPADDEHLTAILTADQIDLKARLHEQAAEQVTTTLTRMQQRTRQAARATPELEPFLSTYFEAAGTSLLQHTLAVLNDPPRQPSIRPVSPPRRPAWPFTIRRLIPVRKRQEQPDGTA
jgi:hypothetical protein